MENLSLSLKAIFSQQDADEILRAAGLLKSKSGSCFGNRHLDIDLNESEITSLLLDVEKGRYSIDQLALTGQMVISKWIAPDPNCLPLQFSNKDSVFNVILHYASRILKIKDGDPICRYQHLLRWHLLTTQLGEDLFTTALLAAGNLKVHHNRTQFDWEPYLDHDYNSVNAIFQRPMVDLHMHLKGSSFNFDVSWLCLMGHVEEMADVFEKLSTDRKDTKWDDELYGKIRRAAAIRYYLAGKVGLVNDKITSSRLFDYLNDTASFVKTKASGNEKKDETEEEKNVKEEVKINYRSLGDVLHSATVGDGQKGKSKLDYIAIDHYNKESVCNSVMASERKLMYSLFKMVFSGEDRDPDTATLFYAYLVYKDMFRHIILQLNERVGFRNFANYESLKTDFIKDEFQPLVYKAALDGFVGRSKNRYVEARIVPKSSEEEINKSLKTIYDAIDSDNKERCSVIFHFIKRRDESFKECSNIRHSELRLDVQHQAFAIYDFRRNRAAEDNMVGRVVGIDAANSEIYARPEVFAQAFRFLRSHDVFETEDERPDDLHITYHVGEDFLDIADGLRAVNEALLFLGMQSGDRLGHALVLGTDVRKYYKNRYHTICESKQVLLDNMAWLYHKCLRLMGACPLSAYLETMFHKYFREMMTINNVSRKNIIDEIMSPVDESMKDLDNIEEYYLSWLLRGNSPTWGSDWEHDKVAGMTTDKEREWLNASLNHHPQVEIACRNENARTLYDMYHSSAYAFHSNEVDSFTIPQKYREEYYTLLEKIQDELLDKIEKRHIAIECNPSSNYKIGEIERYDQHPILKFFNDGLDTPYKKRNISVSINTDDQGIFSTSLEREYSLMALALERNEMEGHYNSPRAIIDWLDRVRQMSLEQKFDRTNIN